LSTFPNISPTPKLKEHVSASDIMQFSNISKGSLNLSHKGVPSNHTSDQKKVFWPHHPPPAPYFHQINYRHPISHLYEYSSFLSAKLTIASLPNLTTFLLIGWLKPYHKLIWSTCILHTIYLVKKNNCIDLYKQLLKRLK